MKTQHATELLMWEEAELFFEQTPITVKNFK